MNTHPQYWVDSTLDFMPQLLLEMSLAICVANGEAEFITSDRPCVMFNPELGGLPPFHSSPGLTQKGIEVTLPLTPKHLLMFSRSSAGGYVEADEAFVDEANRRTRAACYEYFVSRREETKAIWFELRKSG